MRIHSSCVPAGGSHLQNRRDFLRVGGLGLASLCLPDFLRDNPATAGVQSASEPDNATMIRFQKGKSDEGISIIQINMQGGLSLWDTFDFKTHSSIKGPFKPINESPSHGVLLPEELRELETHIGKFTIIRNLYHKNSFHDASTGIVFTESPAQVSSAFDASPKNSSPFLEFTNMLIKTGGSNIGYVVLHTSTKRDDIEYDWTNKKPNVVVRSNYSPYKTTHYETDGALYFPVDTTTGEFTNPFQGIEDAKEYKRKMELRERMQEFDLRIIDSRLARYSGFIDQANDLTLGEFNKAFDINGESQETREKYGNTEIGKQLLLARRMVEAGARFITVNMGDLDHHSLIEKNLKTFLRPFSIGTSALIEDIEGRGLKVIVAFTSEFGRTPKVNREKGRDHWPQAFGAALYDYRRKEGQIIGETNNKGEIAGGKTHAHHASKLGPTILNLLGLERFNVRNGEVSDYIDI